MNTTPDILGAVVVGGLLILVAIGVVIYIIVTGKDKPKGG